MKWLPQRALSFITAAAIFFSLQASAWAHAHPTAMSPSADATVASPSVVSISFSEPLEPRFSSVDVLGDGGKKINTSTSTPKPGDPKTLTLTLPALHSGTYTVHWVSVAADGHRMEGRYKFTVR